MSRHAHSPDTKRQGATICASASMMRRIQLALWLLFASLHNAVAEPRSVDTMGLGLAGIADWSTQQPFIDVFKTARPWIGHRPGAWGGMTETDLIETGLLDENGWPVRIPGDLSAIGTMIFTDMPHEAVSLAGRYRLHFDGDGIVEVSGKVETVRYGANTVEFDYFPGSGAVQIDINRTDRRRTGDYVRNITVVKLDHLQRHAGGELFNPDWIARVGKFGTLRFMDWMNTNDSELANWQDRPRPEDYVYSKHGVPIEALVELSNITGANPWFTMPHQASDDFVRRFAEFVHDHLAPGLVAYVEYSNEVWNWQFEQAVWTEERAMERWGIEYRWTQYYGLRTAEVARIWKDVFADQASARLVIVISTQTGWMGLEQDMLNAPLWADEDVAHGKPSDYADAYAIAGYFGRILGTPERAEVMRAWVAQSKATAEQKAMAGGMSGTAFDAYVAAHRYDEAIARAAVELRNGSVSGDLSDTIAALRQEIFPYHARVAAEHGLTLIMYEGGTHIAGVAEILDDDALTDFFVALNYAPEMSALYTELLEAWSDAGGRLFNAYADITMPSKWGSWGNLRHLDDNSPRWDALVEFE